MIYALLILPALVLIFIVFGFPIIRYFWLSIHASSVLTGLTATPNYGANWIRLLNDDRFWLDTIQTIRFTMCSVLIEIVLAIVFALILNQNFRGRGLVRSLSILPWALPTTIMALGWRWIFNTPYGPIERIVSIFSTNSINILSNPNIAWIATVFADIWKTTPFITLIILAGLQTIPTDLYEAFKLESGDKLKSFFNITLPLLQPYLIISIIFRLAQAFGVFDLIQVLTLGGPAGSTESIGLYAYLNAMRFLDFGYSATIIFFSFILLSLFCILAWLLINKIRDKYQRNML